MIPAAPRRKRTSCRPRPSRPPPKSVIDANRGRDRGWTLTSLSVPESASIALSPWPHREWARTHGASDQGCRSHRLLSCVRVCVRVCVCVRACVCVRVCVCVVRAEHHSGIPALRRRRGIKRRAGGGISPLRDNLRKLRNVRKSRVAHLGPHDGEQELGAPLVPLVKVEGIVPREERRGVPERKAARSVVHGGRAPLETTGRRAQRD